MSTTDTLYRIHLDPVGGIAGDMFIASLLDAFPDLAPGLFDEVRKIPSPAAAALRLEDHRQAGFAGKRFIAEEDGAGGAGHRHGKAGGHDAAGGHHDHVSYRAVREILANAPLIAPVREHALAMFSLLAEAEGRVHGIVPEEVAFHEVGAWDSLVDFVGAAFLIHALSPKMWTWAPVPLGGGRVGSAHGILPVPSPATVLLLRDIAVIDDGVAGERVTPTGAAILKYLSTFSGTSHGPMVTRATGIGFGQSRLKGLANLLRCIAFGAAGPESVVMDEEIALIEFEVDDQPAEDLAIALERIRAAPGAHEANLVPVYGKKGRLAMQVQVQCEPIRIDSLARLCFEETTTLGLRVSRMRRKLLPRENLTLADPPAARVKVADRPSGTTTAKAEADDLARLPGGRAAREAARREVEQRAVAQRASHARRKPRSD